MIRKEFQWNDTPHSIEILHFLEATQEQADLFDLRHGDFLVHLNDGRTTRVFSMFLDDVLQWNTKGKLNDPDHCLIKKIGVWIDDCNAG